jgi:hypothetical protein
MLPFYQFMINGLGQNRIVILVREKFSKRRYFIGMNNVPRALKIVSDEINMVQIVRSSVSSLRISVACAEYLRILRGNICRAKHKPIQSHTREGAKFLPFHLSTFSDYCVSPVNINISNLSKLSRKKVEEISFVSLL